MCLSSLERGVDPPEQELKVIVSYPVWVLRISPSHLQEWYALSTTELSLQPLLAIIYGWVIIIMGRLGRFSQTVLKWDRLSLGGSESPVVYGIMKHCPYTGLVLIHHMVLYHTNTGFTYHYTRTQQWRSSDMSELVRTLTSFVNTGHMDWRVKNNRRFFFPYSSRSWEVQD